LGPWTVKTCAPYSGQFSPKTGGRQTRINRLNQSHADKSQPSPMNPRAVSLPLCGKQRWVLSVTNWWEWDRPSN